MLFKYENEKEKENLTGYSTTSWHRSSVFPFALKFFSLVFFVEDLFSQNGSKISEDLGIFVANFFKVGFLFLLASIFVVAFLFYICSCM